MANASTYIPFGFSKPVRIIPKSSRPTGNVTPPKYDSNPSAAKDSSSHRSSGHISVQDDSCWPLPPPSYFQSPTPSSTKPFPDEEHGETMVPNRRSQTPSDTRRLPRLQTTHPTPTTSVTPPIIAPTTADVVAPRTPLTEKQLKQQLRVLYAALSRTEADQERITRQTAASKTDQDKIERELENLKRENQRLRSRLEELLNSSVGTKGDEVWGSSMYMDTDYIDTDWY
ncbi:hypothetical protein BU17DRAFT_62263 [Hysterangium stoloniferum]|nr:hypothetical protein BU17DRAFT_62263 [Hysterangium stoloniferum]